MNRKDLKTYHIRDFAKLLRSKTEGNYQDNFYEEFVVENIS